uniref:Secreted protein n=1 Tax=Octopus bimaculoides TaxID=37653 RepID=A0A0L8HTK4_OCTBM
MLLYELLFSLLLQALFMCSRHQKVCLGVVDKYNKERHRRSVPVCCWFLPFVVITNVRYA